MVRVVVGEVAALVSLGLFLSTVAVGADVPDATIKAIKLEALAEVTVQAYSTGQTPKQLTDEDIRVSMAAWKPQSHIYTKWTWGFYRKKFGLDGRA